MDTICAHRVHIDPLVQRSAEAKPDFEKRCESTDHTCSKRTAAQVVGLDAGSDFGMYPNWRSDVYKLKKGVNRKGI